MSGIAILKLQRAGFTEQQVETLADYFDSRVAMKTTAARPGGELSAKCLDLKRRNCNRPAAHKMLKAEKIGGMPNGIAHGAGPMRQMNAHPAVDNRVCEHFREQKGSR
jgi:hypothetical protein